MATTVTRPEFDRLCGDVKEIADWKDGNGRPGAKVTLSLLEERWTNVEKKIDRIYTVLIALLVSVLGGVVLWFFTNYLPNHI